jgi:hypothetical protein
MICLFIGFYLIENSTALTPSIYHIDIMTYPEVNHKEMIKTDGILFQPDLRWREVMYSEKTLERQSGMDNPETLVTPDKKC